MKRFDKKGMMIYPNPVRDQKVLQKEEILVIKQCYCPNGHSLISSRVMFNEFEGLVFKVKRSDKEGLVALTPVFGNKSRITIDVDLKDGEIWKIFCPECDIALPYYTKCECGADLTTFFTNNKADYGSILGLCNRVGCYHATIRHGDELLTKSMLEAL